MKIIQRALKQTLVDKMFSGRALLLLGARRVGKSTIVEEILTNLKLENNSLKLKSFNCDDPEVIELLDDKGMNYIKGLIGDTDIIFIDEAHKLPTIGNLAKLIVDKYGKSKQLILSGSSSLNLLSSTYEPLTGRKYVYVLYPLALDEIKQEKSYVEFSPTLEQLQIYGSYPEILTTTEFDAKEEKLDELADSYLYKDIFEFQTIKNPNVLRELLKLIALQIGSLVSYSEIGNRLGIDKNTVINYIDLLEKNFIIFRLPAYTKNKRREIGQSRKIFFYDLGIRNEVLNDFRELKWRNDAGAIWENFLICERLKYLKYNRIKTNLYFWQSYDGAEVDLVEEYPDRLVGYEIKSGVKQKVKAPMKWMEYSNATFKVIAKDNYWELFSS